MKRNLNVGYRVVLTLAIAGLSLWALKGGADLGERAGFIQAVLAGVLLWATWSAIDRSDKQIDIAIEQVKLSQQQMAMLSLQDEVHYLGANIEGWNIVRIFNLSRMPVYILTIEQRYDRNDEHYEHSSDGVSNVIDGGHSSRFAIVNVDEPEIQKRMRLYASSVNKESYSYDLNDPLEGWEVSVEYQYGGTGSMIYRKVYSLMCYQDTWSKNTPFKIRLIPKRFERFKPRGLGEPYVEKLPLDSA